MPDIIAIAREMIDLGWIAYPVLFHIWIQLWGVLHAVFPYAWARASCKRSWFFITNNDTPASRLS
jgi:hypothetical protein